MKVQRTTGINNADARIQNFQIAKALAGNITFGQTMDNTEQGVNIQGWKASGTTPVAANTEFAVPHQLGRIPLGFLILYTNIAAHLYKSTTAWTASNIYLKCDQSGVGYAIIVI